MSHPTGENSVFIHETTVKIFHSNLSPAMTAIHYSKRVPLVHKGRKFSS